MHNDEIHVDNGTNSRTRTINFLTFIAIVQTAQEMVAHAGHKPKALPLRGRCEICRIVCEGLLVAAAEHAVRLTAACVSVGEARAMEALRRNKEGKTHTEGSNTRGRSIKNEPRHNKEKEA